LSENAKECVGIDISKNGIEYMKEKLNYKDVFCCDLLKPNVRKITQENFDYMVLGEIIEHVENPYNFLLQINTLYKENVSKIIITTPNAFSYNNFVNAKNGFEVINSDHKTIFSPYTLIKILFMSGYKIEKIDFANPTFKIWHKIINTIIRQIIFSNKITLSNTIIITASFK